MHDVDTDRESPHERHARRLIELLNEVRIALPGVQILFAFLLTLPFTARFDTVRGIDRDVYAASLVASAVASILFISVAAEHRLRWRQGEKADIVDVSHRAMIWGLGFLALGMSGAIFVVLRAVLGDAQGAVIAVATLTAFGWFWFCLPLIRRSSRAPRPRRSGGHPARGGDGAPRGATMRARRESPVSSEHEEPLVIDVQNGS